MEQLVSSGDVISQIFDGQLSLVDHYIKIEDLPPYPLDTTTKKNQKLLKEFIGRGIEELAEAHEAYKIFFYRISSNAPEESILEAGHNFCEELSDALHFFTETLIFAGISPGDIQSFMVYYQADLFTPLRWELGPNIFDLAEKLLVEEGYSRPFNPFTKNLTLWPIRLTVNVSRVKQQARLLWEITYQFKLACHALKNKTWYTEELITNNQDLRKQLVLGYEALFMLFRYHDFTLNNVLAIYQYKNKINHERIQKQL